MVGSYVKEFILSFMDERGKLSDKLMFRPEIEEPPSLFPRILLQHEESLKKRDPRLEPKNKE